MNHRTVTSRANKTILVAVLCATLFVLPATATTMSDLMRFLPADGHVAIGLPDIEAVESAGQPLMQLGPLSDLSSLAVMLGGDTLSEGLANCGVNANAPGAIFLSVASAHDVRVAGVLMVADADTVKDTMPNLLGGDGAEVSLPGDIAGRFVAGSGVGYFLNDDKLFIASSEALMEQLAARIAAPADVNYVAKDEVVIWSRIDIIQENDLLSLMDELSHLNPVLNSLSSFSDEVIFAIGEELGEAYVRVAARDSSGEEVPSPGTLALHGYMDADAPLLANLRLTPQLIGTLASALSQNPATRQVGGYIRLASSLLGDEMAVSLRAMDGSIPDALIAVTVQNPNTVPNLLRMVANIDEPSYQHNDTDVYVYETGGVDLNIAVAGETIIVAPGEENLKSALASFEEATGSGVPAPIVNRGPYGFVVFDGAKAAALDIDFPNIEDVDVALLLGIDGPWRQAVLTSPAGLAGIGAMLQGVL